MLLDHPQIEIGYISRVGYLGLYLARIVVFLFSGFFVLYSLGAFLQVRKKEFGLLTMHGMRLSQLRKLIFIENSMMGGFALLIGIATGLCFMKLFLLVGETMLGITHLPFYIPWMTIGLTTLVYGALFLVVSFISTYMIRINQVKELLHGTSKPKPYPKTSLILILVALISIGYGYYRSVTTNSIDLGKDLLIVAPFIMIGTYFLFTQASVFIVKRLQQKKSRHWKKTRLLLASNLMFKLKDNSRIFFLVTIVTTGAMSAVGAVASLSTIAEQEVAGQPFAFSYVSGNIHDASRPVSERSSNNYDDRREMDLTMLETNLQEANLDYSFFSMPVKGMESESSGQSVALFSEMYYNEAMGISGGEEVTIRKGEAVLIPAFLDSVQSLRERRIDETISILHHDTSFSIQDVVERPLIPDTLLGGNLVILNDLDYEAIKPNMELKFDGFYVPDWRKAEGLDNNLRSERTLYANVADRYVERMELYSTMIFIGVMIGLVFFLTAGSFLYFRIYTDLKEDQKRFLTLKKLGLTERETKRLVSLETAILFFLPFIIAMIHAGFAFIALQTMYELSIHSSMIIVVIIFTVAQIVYFLIMKQHYLKRLLQQMEWE